MSTAEICTFLKLGSQEGFSKPRSFRNLKARTWSRPGLALTVDLGAHRRTGAPTLVPLTELIILSLQPLLRNIVTWAQQRARSF